MAKQETEFKRWWLANWRGWYEHYEPRKGSGVGMPDVQVLMEDLVKTRTELLPIEFKVGQIDSQGTLFVSGFEPAQPSWHYRFNRAGGRSMVMVGVKTPRLPDKKLTWSAYAITPSVANPLTDWQKGFPKKRYFLWERWE